MVFYPYFMRLAKEVGGEMTMRGGRGRPDETVLPMLRVAEHKGNATTD
jgi:hypothetical protein